MSDAIPPPPPDDSSPSDPKSTKPSIQTKDVHAGFLTPVWSCLWKFAVNESTGHEMKDVESAKAAGLRVGRLLFTGAAFCVVIFVAAWGICSLYKSDEISDLKRDRDKYEIITKQLVPGEAAGKRLVTIQQAVEKGFLRMEANLVQTLAAIEADDGPAFLGEFPFGYGLFGVDLATNIVSIPFRTPTKANNPIIKWPTLKNVTMDSEDLILDIPLIEIGRIVLNNTRVRLRRSVGVSISANFTENLGTSTFNNCELKSSDPCAQGNFGSNPRWIIVVRIVAIKKLGTVMLFGVKENPKWNRAAAVSKETKISDVGRPNFSAKITFGSLHHLIGQFLNEPAGVNPNATTPTNCWCATLRLEIVNRGSPSIIQAWSLRLQFEEGTTQFAGPVIVPRGGVIVHDDNSQPIKVGESEMLVTTTELTPVAQGAKAEGMITFMLPNAKDDIVKKGKVKFIVSFNDASDRTYQAESVASELKR